MVTCAFPFLSPHTTPACFFPQYFLYIRSFFNSISHLFPHIYFSISKNLISADLNLFDLVLHHAASESNVLLKYCECITNAVSCIFSLKTPTSRYALLGKSQWITCPCVLECSVFNISILRGNASWHVSGHACSWQISVVRTN